MKTKNLVLVLIIVLLSTAFFGCDAINAALDGAFLKATQVDVDTLPTFSGDTPTSDDEVMMGFGEGMSLIMNAMPMSRVLGDDYEPVMKVMDLIVPGLAESRAASSRAGSANYTVSVTDETLESDYETGDYRDDGDLTIVKAEISAQADTDSVLDPTAISEVSAKVEGELELVIENIIDYDYNDVTYAYDIVYSKINECQLNAKGSIEADATIGSDGYPEEVNAYVAIDISLGFSLSSDDAPAGKYLFNFNYVDSATVTESDVTGGDVTGDGEDFVITIEVYGNSGSLVRSVTYTQDELMDLGMSM